MFAHTRPRHIVIVVLTCLTTELCFAGAGDLDPTFGDAGLVTTDFGTIRDLAQGVAVQADGKIVVVGLTLLGPGFRDFALARYNSDGSLDCSFGSGGRVTTNFGSSSRDDALCVALQSDGKIVVAGFTINSTVPEADFTNIDFALARYNLDGSLDNSFGSGGLVITDFGFTRDLVHSIAIQADGKIVAAGESGAFPPDPHFALARYNADGSLDSHFGSDGLIVTIVGSLSSRVASIAIQPDGKIVAAGTSWESETLFNFALARYNGNNGSLDTGFGSDGFVSTDMGFFSQDRISSIAILADGKIVAAGRSGTGNRSALVRYHPDGILDSSFGSGGKAITDFMRFRDLAIQDDGKIVTAGVSIQADTGFDFAVARYLADGSPDGSFGSGGLVTTDFGFTSAQATGMVIQVDGKIVAVGFSIQSDINEFDFALARYEVDITTAVGTNVVVQPNDPTTGESSVTMTFDQVDQAGTTTVITSETGPTPPTGFRLASDPPTFYEITTTAVFSESIEVCIDYSGLILTAPETSLSLMHFEDGEWIDATTSLDTINDIICGTVSSLSPFVIMENLGLAELLLSLGQAVTDLNLQQGIDNSLDAKLDSAMQALQDINQNNDVAAINSLEAFINAVLAQSGNQISVEDGDELIATAQAITALLG